MVIGLTGWMDGGYVSTGAVDYLRRKSGAKKLAEMDPDEFYLFSFPGSMEVTAVFRPRTRIEGGLVRELDLPSNDFFYSEEKGLILFSGQEPHLRWNTYVDCIMAVAEKYGVRNIYFVGSVASSVPHTRPVRVHSSVSGEELKVQMQRVNVRFSEYEGPSSIVTLLMQRVSEEGRAMVTLVSEMPLYVQGRNPACIEAVTRRLAALLEMDSPELGDLKKETAAFEKRINESIGGDVELTEQVRRLEEAYDSESQEPDMTDLKHWLKEKGIRL